VTAITTWFVEQLIYFQRCTYVFTLRGTPIAKRDSLFSAEDAAVSAAEADSNSQVIASFDKCSAVKELQIKSSPATRHGGAWAERRYSSYSFLTSALDGGEWSGSRPGLALPRGKDPRYPLDRRLGGPQSRSGHRG
jgi:hypothetical protein